MPLSTLVNCLGSAVASLSDIFVGSPFVLGQGVLRVRLQQLAAFRDMRALGL